jgi:hypothetical protein
MLPMSQAQELFCTDSSRIPLEGRKRRVVLAMGKFDMPGTLILRVEGMFGTRLVLDGYPVMHSGAGLKGMAVFRKAPVAAMSVPVDCWSLMSSGTSRAKAVVSSAVVRRLRRFVETKVGLLRSNPKESIPVRRLDLPP